jgi:tripartite-type tricarboxylate transporter receptor subunit TctC
MHFTRRRILTASVSAAAVAWPAITHAQPKLLRVLVGYPAGGAVDVVARETAEGLRSAGYQAIVENISGAAGRMATTQLLQAPADGGAIVCMPSGNATIFPHVYRNLGHDPMADLQPLGTACRFAFGLAAGPGTPAKTLQEFIAWAKANPTKASYGTPGGGTAMHFLGVMFGRAAGIDFLHVPYKGGAQAIVDVMGGSIPTLLTTVPNLVNPHAQGKVRILAFSGEKPLASLPGVPTFAQAGFPDLTIYDSFAFFARSGTPAAAAASLSAALAASVQSERVVQALRKLEFEPLATEPAALAARLRDEHAKWKRVVAESGYKATD